MDRPGLTRMLDALRPGDSLVCYSLSRLGRWALDPLGTVQRLADSGVIVRSVTESIDTSTPAGRAFLAITLVIAQMERELIVERTQAGLAAARAKGRVGGAKKRLSPAQARSILRAYEAGERVPDIAEDQAVAKLIAGAPVTIAGVRADDFDDEAVAASISRSTGSRSEVMLGRVVSCLANDQPLPR